MTFIPEHNVFALCMVVFGLAWFGFWIDSLEIGRKISGVVWVLCAGMLLSNLQIIPFESQVYDFVGDTLVSLAIPLLLFKSNMRRIFKESGKVMLIFMLASVGTILGAIVGFFMFNLGEIGSKVAGVYTGGYIGGAVNFLAVSQVVGMTEEEFSTAISASSIVSILALMLLLAIPSIRWISRYFPKLDTAETAKELFADEDKGSRLKLTHITGSIALSFAICSLSVYCANTSGLERYTILFITAFTILIANLFPKLMSKLEGEFDTGLLLMYLFFAVVGAGTDMSVFLTTALTLFVYGMFIILIHLTFTLLLAKLFKFKLDEVIVASGAALVGPAVTAAIATSRDWRELVTPGIMCGIFGYAIATFIGVFISGMLA